MNEQPRAGFRFEGYTVNQFSLDTGLDNGTSQLAIDLQPSGLFIKDEGQFYLFLRLNAFPRENEPDGSPKDEIQEGEKPMISATLQAVFKMNAGGDSPPEFFYLNSVAISYPFLRAFISTLTNQANIKTLLLPIANLQHLEKPLRDNTVFIDSRSEINQ